MDNSKTVLNNLFIFELANNHNGDVEHGLRIIREINKVCVGCNLTCAPVPPQDGTAWDPVSRRNPTIEETTAGSPPSFTFGYKLQYRELDTFIHPEYKSRMDIKYVKRFSETRLRESDLKILKDEIKKMGGLAICTPFDEESVALAEKHRFDIIKVGSCSLTDWPLLERIARVDVPVIVSTAGASLEDIDKIVLFFEHREKQFALMHCVGEYPTADKNLQLNQIDLLKERYPGIPIGYSTHEAPDNYEAIKIAIAKGAVIFEKHVGIANDKYPLNLYSAAPAQVHTWLEAAKEAFILCGDSGQRRGSSEKEKADLRGLQRGVFAKKVIKKGEKLDFFNVFFAIPNIDNQIMANDMSKYTEFIAKENIQINQAILFSDAHVRNMRERILEIINKIKPILIDSKVPLMNKLELEISHHYGIENFEQYGAVLINCIHGGCCKKVMILLPGQSHPRHYHAKKEETFNILYGGLTITIDGQEKEYAPGDVVTIGKGITHGFSSKERTVFEEISTTLAKDDSFYEDQRIGNSQDRKTYMTFWRDWLYKKIY